MPLNRPLASLPGSASDPARTIAVGPGSQRLDFPRFLSDVRTLAATFPGDRGKRWLVQTEDAYLVAVLLMSAAMVGARIALPPNLQPGTLRELGNRSDRVFGNSSQQAADARWGDRADAAGIADMLDRRDDDALRMGVDPALADVPTAIDRDAPLVELYTSGSSGPGKLVTKALRHLEDEVVELERSFGNALPADAVVLATVPVHHLYGLLFRVLWPLASARPFARASYLLPDELLARVASVPGAIVVSSPAHLRHLSASPRLAEQAGRITAIFSSGGPLESTTALALARTLGASPFEIFGSTETGGVAFRRQTRTDVTASWQVFAPVAVTIDSEDERLVVTSPFVTPPDEFDTAQSATWRMGDRAQLVDGSFRLLGRADRVAKIGEKTFSLPEIEEWLSEHEMVEAAAVGLYRGRSEPRLGALVVLTAAGRLRLAELGRRALQLLFSEHLAERWDRLALPRRWRFVDALPVDARGKLRADEVETALAAGARDVLEPTLLREQHEGSEHRWEFVVPKDLAYFDGHYESFPLVPGAVQIHWVMTALSRVVGRTVAAERMEAVKFKSVLRPSQVFTLQLHIEGSARADFVLQHEGRVFASGRVAIRN